MNDIDYLDWYNSYTYGSKITCINYILRSKLSTEDKLSRIEYHINNLPPEGRQAVRDDVNKKTTYS